MIKNSDSHKMDLIEIALAEYSVGELTANEAVICIATIINKNEPSKEGIEWAKKIIIDNEMPDKSVIPPSPIFYKGEN